MQQVTDWVRLWRELVEARAESRSGRGRRDAWHTRARQFEKRTRRRWAKPDSSRDYVVSQVQARPGATVLDIGAGTGAWTVLLARYARHVTAVEPSAAMLEVLRQNLAESGADTGHPIDNVTVVEGAWPGVEVEAHDLSLCSHAMYTAADFPAFVRRMEAVTRQRCFLLLRAPTPDGVMAEASMHVWGQPYDSPSFQVAYNALLQIGIFAHVRMEDRGLWRPWTHDSLEEALADVKRRLGLPEPSEHDEFLRDLLRRRLAREEGRWVWPRAVRSALVYWDVGSP
jgi:SAM-dependent methyltransferase